MLLKRIYDENDLERFKNEREQARATWLEKFKEIGVPDALLDSFARQVADPTVNLPLIVGLDIEHTGFKPEQNFSTSMVTEFIKLGLMEIDGDQLTLHAQPEHLQYTIKREPGRWCLHCGEKLADDANGELARLHIAMKHNGVPSPSESDPSGYVWLTYFECVLDETQHEAYKKGA